MDRRNKSGDSIGFTASQWIAWLGGLVVASTCVTVWAFSTFVTKADASVRRADYVARLDRIEAKIDSLIARLIKDN